jgi:succinate dehydrogenase flavin-adding protein (antitoxin of CptAB toxin-antitoxin module)
MKELDVLLEHFLEHRYAEAAPDIQAAFRALLEEQDPVILGYISGREMPMEEGMRHVVESLRAAHRS